LLPDSGGNGDRGKIYLMESALLDHRQLTFDPSKIEPITLVRDMYMGLGLITAVEGGHVIASLEPNSQFELTFLKPDEGPGPRFYVSGCALRLDLKAVADHRKDPPLGSLIVAKAGISLMVKPPRRGPSPLAIVGGQIDHAYQGLCITRWRLLSNDEFGKAEILFDFEVSSTQERAAG
jgi:hypothetical protein